jgi:heat shock protein HslJ
MMHIGVRAAAAALLLLSGCSPAPSGGTASADTAAATAAAAAAPSFVNRVWTVAESPQVASGDTRVFLADGTMVMTGPSSTPAFGKWRVKDGSLSITEEGQEYPVDVVELTSDVFRIRIRGPGEPVDIRFTPAEQPAPGGPAAPPVLAGTAWRLEDLAGAGVIDRARASLEFPDTGRVSGSASCNRFTGSVTVSGAAISFGPLATTRKICPEALMNQETRYLQALASAARFEVRDAFLYLHTAAGPLRFVRE